MATTRGAGSLSWRRPIMGAASRKTIASLHCVHRLSPCAVDLARAQATTRQFVSLPTCSGWSRGGMQRPAGCRSEVRPIEAIRDGRGTCVAISRWGGAQAGLVLRVLSSRVCGRLCLADGACSRSQSVLRSIPLAAAGPRLEPGAAAEPSRRPPRAHCWHRPRGCLLSRAPCSWAGMPRCRSSWQSRSCRSAQNAW